MPGTIVTIRSFGILIAVMGCDPDSQVAAVRVVG